MRTLVLGVGNPLMQDDGIGLAALASLREGWTFDDGVELMDGGTWGMSLLPAIEDADRVLILDAIGLGGAPGTPVVLQRDELPRFFATKLSPHQIGLQEVLALAELRGTLPAHTLAVGLVPERVELQTSLSPSVRARLPEMVALAVGVLHDWGHGPRRTPDYARSAFPA